MLLFPLALLSMMGVSEVEICLNSNYRVGSNLALDLLSRPYLHALVDHDPICQLNITRSISLHVIMSADRLDSLNCNLASLYVSSRLYP